MSINCVHNPYDIGQFSDFWLHLIYFHKKQLIFCIDPNIAYKDKHLQVQSSKYGTFFSRKP